MAAYGPSKSDTAIKDGLPIRTNVTSWAWAEAALSARAAAAIEPVNNFIAVLLSTPRLEELPALLPTCPVNFIFNSGGPWSLLGPDRGVFASNRGRIAARRAVRSKHA